MSLRVKFLGLLVVVPSFCLVLFLYFAISTFVMDKKNYLFENQFQLLNSAQVFLDIARPAAFVKQIRKLSTEEGFENLLVIDNNGIVRHSEQSEAIGKPLASILGQGATDKLAGQAVDSGSFESVDQANQGQLVSFLKVTVGGVPYVLILHAAQSGAMRASMIFLFKSLSTFVALLSLAIVISLVFSNKLTRGIHLLSQSMLAFGKGDFESPVPKLPSDEVGAMAHQFQLMRTQIQNLISEKEEKTKIETEMKLAGDLQKRFFPPSFFRVEGIELAGYFEQAHDAGGDWWFYFQKGRKLIFLIGDVTGHGLNAAMVTGVCRSAFSLIEDNYQGPKESMRLLNRAVFDTAHGELNMTCVICALDLDSGEITFANASHESPYIVPAKRGYLKRSDFRFLNGQPGRRLGEVRDAEYSEYQDQLDKGEMLLLYSDGLTELCNPNDVMFGERRLLRAMGDNHTLDLSAQDVLDKIRNQALRFRSSQELKDDLSFMVIRWRASASQET